VLSVVVQDGAPRAGADASPDRMGALRYVLTVPDDLYARMMRELDDYCGSHGTGFYFCCHETYASRAGRVDIWVAAGILGLLFLALAICSIASPFS